MGIDVWEIIEAAKTKPFDLSRPWSRRSLHPDRSVLSDLEGSRIRSSHPLHRIGREHREFAGRRSTPLSREALADFDAALICTDHDVIDYAALTDRCPLVIDTRNVCARLGLAGDTIVKA